ncbi:hypothetical protein PHLCEN_2v3929 [Hermanssonia centrifuga]|uniref:Uncharacterized protein n=1 Tax=Hermanssonia centrifuga TaxID=98765 RepID=A0A2R6QB61_9APHY|nr:hypothetical protein PHLCEN_2v3929 [Hermanssonia centrifuga]
MVKIGAHICDETGDAKAGDRELRIEATLGLGLGLSKLTQVEEEARDQDWGQSIER